MQGNLNWMPGYSVFCALYSVFLTAGEFEMGTNRNKKVLDPIIPVASAAIVKRKTQKIFNIVNKEQRINPILPFTYLYLIQIIIRTYLYSLAFRRPKL